MYQVCQPYAFVHACDDVHQNLCTLVETDLGLIPVVAIGTTYTALCFHNFPTSNARSCCVLCFLSRVDCRSCVSGTAMSMR